MKNLSNILGMAGVLALIYALLGRFVGAPTIGLGILHVKAEAALTLANSLLLLSIVIKQWEK